MYIYMYKYSLFTIQIKTFVLLSIIIYIYIYLLCDDISMFNNIEWKTIFVDGKNYNILFSRMDQ